MTADAITDPATELFGLLERMKGFQSNIGEPSHRILRRLFTIDGPDAEFLNLISIVLRRFERLQDLIHRAPSLTQAHKTTALNATAALGEMFTPDRLVQGWSSNIQTITQDGRLQTIQFLSPAISPLVSYRIPSQEEREKFLAEIDAALSDLQDQSDVAAEAMISSLKSLRFVLEKLDFFGVEELRARLKTATANFQIANVFAKKAPYGKTVRFAAIGAILMGLANTIIAVHDVPKDALELYQGYVDPVVHWIGEETQQYFLPQNSSPLLAPPASVTPALPPPASDAVDTTSA